MITLKFGGTSMANARRMINSAGIIAERAKTDRVSVVVSAAAGVSDYLQNSIERSIERTSIGFCVDGKDASEFIAALRQKHADICHDLERELPGFTAAKVTAGLEEQFSELLSLLNAIQSLGESPASAHCRIMGMGELLSAPIMAEILVQMKLRVQLLDSRKYILTTGRRDQGDPDFALTDAAFASLCDTHDKPGEVLLFPGFVCGWVGEKLSGDEAAPVPVPGLLGRNGSDFSAAIVAAGLGAQKVEFWTDVDGIYTADPRIVKDAILMDEMTYEEAVELSFFGSKVLHPKTLIPLAARGIEAWSLNTMNPGAKGTKIRKRIDADNTKESTDIDHLVRGISCLKDTALISVAGPGMKGRTGMAARIFAAVSRSGSSILLITQSSSEYTISFCVAAKDGPMVKTALETELDLELRAGFVNPIEVRPDSAIVSIVGDGMKRKRGVAGTFFNALAAANVNIRAIAQGSSERSISCVVDVKSGDTAIRAVHRFFFHTAQTIEVFAFGTGTIGGALLDQIRDQQADLYRQKIDMKVLCIADINKMLLAPVGGAGDGDVCESKLGATTVAGATPLDLSNWRSDLDAKGTTCSLDAIIAFVQRIKPLNPVFVDCTASYDLPERYLDILGAGMHIATPNKRANSMSNGYYHALRNKANAMRRRFLYETNVGAGLPIIDTLQNLYSSGDTLTGFSGIMSGSLSYIFGRLDEGATFSQAVLEAREKRFTEPDPRDDLSGLDVARKALIIARESGLTLELEDIEMQRVFPADFDDSGTVDEFLKKLPQADAYFRGYMAKMAKEGKTLRMGAAICVSTEKIAKSNERTSKNFSFSKFPLTTQFVEPVGRETTRHGEKQPVFRGARVTVGILEVAADHPLFSVKGGENAFVFTTNRYSPIPLSIRGYGAGAGVTAAGVFGDILRTVSWTPIRQPLR